MYIFELSATVAAHEDAVHPEQRFNESSNKKKEIIKIKFIKYLSTGLKRTCYNALIIVTQNQKISLCFLHAL